MLRPFIVKITYSVTFPYMTHMLIQRGLYSIGYTGIYIMS